MSFLTAALGAYGARKRAQVDDAERQRQDAQSQAELDLRRQEAVDAAQSNALSRQVTQGQLDAQKRTADDAARNRAFEMALKPAPASYTLPQQQQYLHKRLTAAQNAGDDTVVTQTLSELAGLATSGLDAAKSTDLAQRPAMLNARLAAQDRELRMRLGAHTDDVLRQIAGRADIAHYQGQSRMDVASYIAKAAMDRTQATIGGAYARDVLTQQGADARAVYGQQNQNQRAAAADATRRSLAVTSDDVRLGVAKYEADARAATQPGALYGTTPTLGVPDAVSLPAAAPAAAIPPVTINLQPGSGYGGGAPIDLTTPPPWMTQGPMSRAAGAPRTAPRGSAAPASTSSASSAQGDPRKSPGYADLVGHARNAVSRGVDPRAMRQALVQRGTPAAVIDAVLHDAGARVLPPGVLPLPPGGMRATGPNGGGATPALPFPLIQ